MTTKSKITLPAPVRWLIDELGKAGFEAYAVGGGVRDLLLGREPKDWDVATVATPKEIQKVFPKAVYANRFGTVGVRKDGETYEVTTYRTESGYSDARHPDKVTFVRTLKEDLARRDFTINAIAANAAGELTDPHDGRKDLAAKRVKAVGKPAERFAEDALRMVRAVRFAAELSFAIEVATQKAIPPNAARLGRVSAERIRDELMRILASPNPYEGIKALHDLGLLKLIIPELLEGEGFDQAKHHKDPVLTHNLLALKHTPATDPLVRLAALLHDVGKPQSARGRGEARTFHGHEVIGARMTKEIMRRLKFSKEDSKRVVNLVRHHMFLFQFESTDKAVRRIIRRVGNENIDDLVALRVGDRLGSGTKVGYTTKLKQFRERVVEVQKDPIDTRMLKIDGSDLMKLLKVEPGPLIGKVMDALLEEVLDDPARNTKPYLSKRARELFAELSATV